MSALTRPWMSRGSRSAEEQGAVLPRTNDPARRLAVSFARRPPHRAGALPLGGAGVLPTADSLSGPGQRWLSSDDRAERVTAGQNVGRHLVTAEPIAEGSTA